MFRRKLLLASGSAFTAVLAGCASGNEEIEGGSRDDDDDEEDGNEADERTDTTSDNDSEDGSEDESEDGSADVGSADLEILDHEMVLEEGDFLDDVYVAATVENSGDERSGQIELQVDWYDEEGNYLDNDTGRLRSLPAGGTWTSRTYALTVDAEDVDDYEIEGEYGDDPRTGAEGLTLVDSSMVVQGDELEIEGQVENETDEDEDYVEVVATVYDGEGRVMGDEWTNVTDLRAGETWAFQFEHFGPDIRNRVEEAADHEVFVTDSVW
ncbi:FxLYD domain-containing protein [Salinilacihabitans rarus]|uniref:FxLYD domain-containing protein n=1 Tax=Salinilacihabitans rarus TaxID=2961596 RepID=UPI0020C83E47|nr:FxLYD domain-containing protein [Salinilacihabitans rarus]